MVQGSRECKHNSKNRKVRARRIKEEKCSQMKDADTDHSLQSFRIWVIQVILFAFDYNHNNSILIA